MMLPNHEPRPLPALPALTYGAAANLRENAGGTLLYRAALQGAVPLVAALLAAGASCAPCGVLRRTALHAAIHPASEGQKVAQIVALLLAAQVRPDVTDARGVTPLHGAARYGLFATARLLVEAGAPVDAADDAGVTPLHEAAQAGRWDMCALLLSHGPDSRCTNRSGCSQVGLRADHTPRGLTGTGRVTGQQVPPAAASLV